MSSEEAIGILKNWQNNRTLVTSLSANVVMAVPDSAVSRGVMILLTDSDSRLLLHLDSGEVESVILRGPYFLRSHLNTRLGRFHWRLKSSRASVTPWY